MIVHQVFAIIDGDGNVIQPMVCKDYEEANRVARCAFGDNALAVDCLQYPCQGGDKYHDGKFWHVEEDGTETEIPYVPTQEQQVAALQTLNNELTLAMAEMIGGEANVE